MSKVRVASWILAFDKKLSDPRIHTNQREVNFAELLLTLTFEAKLRLTIHFRILCKQPGWKEPVSISTTQKLGGPVGIQIRP